MSSRRSLPDSGRMWSVSYTHLDVYKRQVHFSAYTGEWNIEGKSYDRSNVKAYSTYGLSLIHI